MSTSWCEVAKFLKRPEVNLRGLQAQATSQGNQGLAAEIDKAERHVKEIQAEEDRRYICMSVGKSRRRN
jgi:hypothetical protein